MDIDIIFKALADANRRQLLDWLRIKNGQTLSQLHEGLNMSRQAVTKHLLMLEKANLVITKKCGREKLHYLNIVPIYDIVERWIGKFELERLHVLNDLKLKLEKGIQMTTTTKSKADSKTLTGSEFIYVIYIRTTCEKLWDAITKPEFTKQYWYGSYHVSNWHKGDSWKLVNSEDDYSDTGEILEVEKPYKLVIKWRNEIIPELTKEGYSQATIELEQLDETVKLTIIHQMDKHDSKFIKRCSNGWPIILSNLKSLLETGSLLENVK